MASIGSLVVDIRTDTARFASGMDKANKKLDSFGKNAQRASQLASRAFVALGAAVGAIRIKDAIKDQIDLGDQFSKLSQRTNVSAEALSRLAYAGELTDVSLQTLGKSITKMQKSLSEAETGLATAANAFNALGIPIQELKNLAPEDQILVLADAFNAIQDPADRARYAMDIFGRSGVELLTLFDSGAEGIKAMMSEADALGKTFTQLEADQMAATNDAFTRFGAVMGQTSKAIAVYLGPTLEALADFLGNTLPQAAFYAAKGITYARSSFVDWAGSIAGFLGMEDAAANLKDLGEVYRDEAALMEFQTKQFSVTTGEASDYADLYDESLTRLVTTKKKVKTAAEKLNDKINEQISALKLEAATLGMTEEQITLYKLSLDGATKAQMDAAEAALNSIAAYQQQQELIAEGQQIFDQTRTAMERLGADLERLDELYAAGVISFDTYARATMDKWEEMEEKTKKTTSKMASISERAAENIHDAFAEFFFDPFGSSLDDMVGNFTTALRKMAANLAASEVMSFLGGMMQGSSVGWISSLGSAFTKYASSFPGFATGGNFTVGGTGGTDSQLVAFRATPGEQVSVATPSQQGTSGGDQTINLNMTVNALDSKSVLQSMGGIKQELATMLTGTMRQYNLAR